jgi:hypothetical protein
LEIREDREEAFQFLDYVGRVEALTGWTARVIYGDWGKDEGLPLYALFIDENRRYLLRSSDKSIVVSHAGEFEGINGELSLAWTSETLDAVVQEALTGEIPILPPDNMMSTGQFGIGVSDLLEKNVQAWETYRDLIKESRATEIGPLGESQE